MADRRNRQEIEGWDGVEVDLVAWQKRLDRLAIGVENGLPDRTRALERLGISTISFMGASPGTRRLESKE